MKILLIDIETSPNTAYVWGIWKENIPIQRIIESSELLCYSAKWYNDDTIIYDSKYYNSVTDMLQGLWTLLDNADIVVHYNGNAFDIPVINKEFLRMGFLPPSPAKQVDLCLIAKSKFRFLSNKLDYICQYLGIGRKSVTNFELWVDCMRNDPKAWQKMEKYNKQDVHLLEALYERFRPWITNHPNVGAYTEAPVCPNCGSGELRRRGFQITTTRKYQRFVCKSCGHWSRSTVSEKPVSTQITHAI